MPISSRSKIFADDLKSYVEINDVTEVEEFKLLLNQITLWAMEWQLPVSCGKSCWMLISNRNGFISDENKFVLSNNELHEVHEITDLGVLFDNHLSFYAHITGIIARAKQRLFLI